MGYFALLKDNVVTAVIVADQRFINETSLEVLQADSVVDVSEMEQRPGPGFTYDPVTTVFLPPE